MLVKYKNDGMGDASTRLYLSKGIYIGMVGSSDSVSDNSKLISRNLKICAMGSSSVDSGIEMFGKHAETWYWLQEV